jgi:hypothetical protein
LLTGIQLLPLWHQHHLLAQCFAETLDYENEGLLDEAKLLAESSFPIKPDLLIEKAKEVVLKQKIGLNDNAECLADGFTFRAAFVETPRDEFIQTLTNFKLEDSFDITQNLFGWTVDPLQTNRVWFMSRQKAKHVKDFFGAKATGKQLVLPPQSFHIDFDASGKVTEFGFYTIDRAQGNTGGLGGAFAYFYGVGKPLPFPEGRPYEMSLRRRLFSFVAGALTKLSKKKN